MLQLYESLKHQQQTPKSFRLQLQVEGTRLLLPHQDSTHRERDKPGGTLCSHKTALAASSGSRCTQQPSARGARKGCAARQGLSNQSSTHPPANHPFQQPTQAEAAAFPLPCPAPKQSKRNDKTPGVQLKRGEAELRTPPLSRRMKT